MYSLRQYDEPTEEPGTDLVELEDLKAALGITSSDEDDSLSLMVASISLSFAELCGRSFALRTLTETFVFESGEFLLQRQPLVLWQYPVTEIISVTVDDVEATTLDLEQPSGRLWNTQAAWGGGRVVVAYSGGYDLPAGAPALLRSATIEAVRQRRAFAGNDPTLRGLVTQHGELSVSKQYYSEPASTSAGFSSAILSAVELFRRISA